MRAGARVLRQGMQFTTLGKHQLRLIPVRRQASLFKGRAVVDDEMVLGTWWRRGRSAHGPAGEFKPPVEAEDGAIMSHSRPLASPPHSQTSGSPEFIWPPSRAFMLFSPGAPKPPFHKGHLPGLHLTSPADPLCPRLQPSPLALGT